MHFKRFWAIFTARNKEFIRDRSGFGWNLLFPFLIIVGIGLIFSGKTLVQYKIGVFPASPSAASATGSLAKNLSRKPYVRLIEVDSLETGLQKLKRHRIDLLLRLGKPPYPYWVSEDSPNGYVAEQILRSALSGQTVSGKVDRRKIQGLTMRYIDWLLPGVLAMNMMFSALWGVGYVVVRYRKLGALKRLMTTPLSAFEYLSAQMVSRVSVLAFSTVIVWIGCDLIFDFHVVGHYLDLALAFFTGGLSLTALGLLLASRGTSEELTTGILNFISWPMMFLSEVWFSLEGAPGWIQSLAKIFPLTHMIKAARAVMQDGAGIRDIMPELAILSAFSLIFLSLAAALFSWNKSVVSG